MGLEPSLEKPRAPEPLNLTHEIDRFNSGNEQLERWLKQRAFKNQQGGASRTYVVCIRQHVIAYYCLASGSVVNATAPSGGRRNMPDPIPVVVVGRLAVDEAWQNQGLGKALVRDAILRIVQAAEIVGIRAVLVHAISQQAKQFYEKLGFTVSPIEPMTLMVSVADIKSELGL